MRDDDLGSSSRRLISLFLLLLAVAWPAASTDIGSEAFLAATSTQTLARYVRFRPAEGAIVRLNPPRMSWPYFPDVMADNLDPTADEAFTLQIASDDAFESIAFEIADTPFNFYNFLPELDGVGPWFWRVGYDVGTTEEIWSETMSFTIAQGAPTWDRSGVPAVLDRSHPHPRILMDTVAQSRFVTAEGDPQMTGVIEDEIFADADGTIESLWYLDFPTDDCPEYDPGVDSPRIACNLEYKWVAQELTLVEMAWNMSGDPRYAGFRERFLTLASYPPGGLSSPNGLNPLLVDHKLPTHVTEYLGYFYDWNYWTLDQSERQLVRDSLEWRIDYSIFNFSWSLRTDGVEKITFGNLPLVGFSHEYEGLFPTVIGALAIYDESALAAWTVEMGLHYIIGISSAFGEDEGWNEGVGYGADKLNFLVDASIALDSAFPEIGLFENPIYDEYMEFFSHVAPLGARHSGFGNRSWHEWDWTLNRMRAFRRLGVETDNAEAMANWWETGRLRVQNGEEVSLDPLWSNYRLSSQMPEPQPSVGNQDNRLFAEAGWVTVSSAPPSDLDAQQEGVGMVFQARPRGGYSHSFGSDNGFDIHAYGETIASGGGTTDNLLSFPRHSMSHNTILVNGSSQFFSSKEDYRYNRVNGRDLDRAVPTRARIVAYRESPDWVYWAGDASAAYGPEVGLERFLRHVVFVDDQYFVIFDDLAMEDGKTADFQWLYHFGPAENNPLTFYPDSFAFEYSVGDVEVWVQHVADTAGLEFNDLIQEEGQINLYKCGYDPPVGTCAEDFRTEGWDIPGYQQDWHSAVADAHHVWVTTKSPSKERSFLSVVVPRHSGESRPTITRISDRAVRVTFRGVTRTISFDTATSADIRVDAPVIASMALGYEVPEAKCSNDDPSTHGRGRSRSIG